MTVFLEWYAKLTHTKRNRAKQFPCRTFSVNSKRLCLAQYPLPDTRVQGALADQVHPSAQSVLRVYQKSSQIEQLVPGNGRTSRSTSLDSSAFPRAMAPKTRTSVTP